MKTPAVLLLVALLVLPACTDKKDIVSLRHDLENAQGRVAELEKQTGELKTALGNVSALAIAVSQLKESQDWEKIARQLDDTAYLTPASREYTVVRHDMGYLTVSFEDVEPYANGSRITLRFGNPLSAAINGLSSTIEYGPTNEKGFPTGVGEKSKRVSFIETLHGGSWTNIQVVLDGIPVEKLGFVRLRDLKHTGIVLSVPK